MAETNEFPEWVIEIRERRRRSEAVRPTKGNESRSMYGLLATEANEPDFDDVYKPYRVSLGPTFAELDKYEPAKEMKEECLLYFLDKYDIRVEQCYDALRRVVGELRGAYDGLDQRWRHDTNSFLRMMLLDGAFLVELMRSIKSDEYNPVIRHIVGNDEERKCYLHDILLLENQLPLLLLRTLLDIVYMQWLYMDLEGVYCMFLDSAMNTFGTRNRFIGDEFQGSLHLLDVYRKSLLHHKLIIKKRKNMIRVVNKTRKFYGERIPSATKLVDIGIGFTTSKSTSLLDIQLRHTTLMIPEIFVDGSTKSTFLNFLAFERLRKNVAINEVTSYMYLMGCLVQSSEDASLLMSRGIVSTALQPDEVADLFRRISKNVSHDRQSPEFIDTLTKVRAHYNMMLNEWRKDLYQKYLKSPWAIMSLVAAFLLFTLSIIQTVYSVLSYVNRK